MKNQLIICFGERLRSEWNEGWAREHEICSWLAKNNTVIYIERFNTSRLSLRVVAVGIAKRLRSLFKSTPKNSKSEGIRFIQCVWIPSYLQCFDRINGLLLAYQILRKCRDATRNGFYIWMFQTSKFALLAIKEMPEPIMLLQHCTDRLEFNSAYHPLISQVDKEITQKANLVTTHSKMIAEEKLKLNANTHRLPQGVPPELIEFSEKRAKESTGSICGKDMPKIYYFGSFHHVFDFELVSLAAELYNGYQFVIWGPVTPVAMEKLGHLQKVKLAGFLPHNEAVHRLCECDVCIIPYIRNEFSMGVFPHKLFTYLASGRPIVASRLPDIEEFAPWVDLADDHETFLQLLGKAVARARDLKYMAGRSREIPHLLRKYSLNENLHKLNRLIEKSLVP